MDCGLSTWPYLDIIHSRIALIGESHCEGDIDGVMARVKWNFNRPPGVVVPLYELMKDLWIEALFPPKDSEGVLGARAREDEV